MRRKIVSVVLTTALLGTAMVVQTAMADVETASISINEEETIEDIISVVNEVLPEASAEVERIYYDVPISKEEQAIIQDVCMYYAIDVKLVLAVACKESNFDETAIGDKGRSLGMYQIQPRYWDNIYNKDGELDLMNKLDATVACCEVLTFLYQKYNDTVRVLNAYNTGDPDNYNGYSSSVMQIRKEIKE